VLWSLSPNNSLNRVFDTYNNLIINLLYSTGQVNWNQVVPKHQDFDVRYLLQHEIELMNTVKWLWRPGLE